MAEAVSLHFKYEEDDYVPAVRMYLMRKPQPVFLFGCIYLLSVMCLLLLFSGGLDILLFLICAGGLWLGLFGLIFYVLPRKRYQSEYRFLDEHHLHITESAIISGTRQGRAGEGLTWRRCTKLLEGEGFYLLEHDSRKVTVIPKRVFKNQEEEVFRDILRRKLPPALSSKLKTEKEGPDEGRYVPPPEPPDWR